MCACECAYVSARVFMCASEHVNVWIRFVSVCVSVKVFVSIYLCMSV